MRDFAAELDSVTIADDPEGSHANADERLVLWLAEFSSGHIPSALTEEERLSLSTALRDYAVMPKWYA